MFTLEMCLLARNISFSGILPFEVDAKFLSTYYTPYGTSKLSMTQSWASIFHRLLYYILLVYSEYLLKLDLCKKRDCARCHGKVQRRPFWENGPCCGQLKRSTSVNQDFPFLKKRMLGVERDTGDWRFGCFFPKCRWQCRYTIEIKI